MVYELYSLCGEFQMVDTDMEILRSLVQNSRISISQMSKEIDVPDATISNRLKKLEKNVIKQYTLILDPEKLGLKVTAIIIVQTESERDDRHGTS